MSGKILIPFYIISFFLFGADLSNAAGLQGFDDKNITQIIPLLKKYDVVGINHEGLNDDDASYISIATRIKASPATIIKMLKDPENFYYISTLFKENIILDSHENITVWSWASRHSFLSVTGQNSIVFYPPNRIDFSIDKSSLGSGKFSLRLFDGGKKHVILTITGFLNVDSSEWLIKYLVGNNSAMKHALNVAIGLFVQMGLKHLAQRLEKGAKPKTHKTSGNAGGVPIGLSDSELNIVKKLLTKGEVLLCKSTPKGRLMQASVIGIVDSDISTFEKSIFIPENYQKNISSISDVKVTKSSNEKKVFSWKLGLAIFGLKSVNELKKVASGILLSAVEGDLKGANWLWQLKSLGKRTIVAYHSFVPVKQASAILKSTVNREPYLEHGLILGSNIVMLNAMKK